MNYLLEFTRVIEGALKGNTPKVQAYAEQLVRRLRENGDDVAADRIMRTLGRTSPIDAITTAVVSDRLPVDNESRMTLADELWFEPQSIKVVLKPNAQRQVDEFVGFIRASDRLIASDVGLSPSMLLYGPPGVGKTELAKYVAAELHLPLLVARTDSLISSFLGSTAKNIRLLFQHAKNRPCVLFLDELDSLAKLRDDQHEMGELKRVVVSLLQNVDALGCETVLLAATNHEHLLDPAVWRRFAYKIKLEPPSMSCRLDLIRLFLGRYQLDDDDVSALAAVSDGLTGADLRTLCENAIRLAVVNGKQVVPSTDLYRAVLRTRLNDSFEFDAGSTSQLVRIRDLDPSVFTMRRLAALFGSSESTVCRRLQSPKEDQHVRGSGETPYQGGNSTGGGPASEAGKTSKTRTIRTG